MSWIGLGVPVQVAQAAPPPSSGGGGGGGGGENSAPVIPNVTLQFDIIASS